MPKLTPRTTKEAWHEKHLEGKSIARIARESKKDPRTVDKAIQEITQQRTIAASRERLLNEGLSHHINDLLALVGNLAGWVEAPPADLPLSRAPNVPGLAALSFGTVAIKVGQRHYEKVVLPMEEDSEQAFQWGLLQEHIGPGPLLKKLSAWRQAVVDDVNARLDVIAIMSKRLRDMQIDIQDEFGSAPSTLRTWAYCKLGDACVARALGAEPLDPQVLRIGDDGTVQWGLKTAGRFKDAASLRDLEQLPAVIADSDAANRLQEIHGATVGAVEQVQTAAYEIRAVHYLPGACRACKRLGMR